MKALIVCLAFFSSTLLASEIDRKLERQWQRYQRAQQSLKRHYKTQRTPFPRDKWEKLIGAQDIAGLRQRQEMKIDSERLRNRERSRIKFENWRRLTNEEALKRVGSFCAEVPKGGMLHIHPLGTMSPLTARALLESRDPVIPLEKLRGQTASAFSKEEREVLKGLGEDRKFSSFSEKEKEVYLSFFVLPQKAVTFSRFEAVFFFVATTLRTGWDDYQLLLDDFFRRAHGLGVFYVELNVNGVQRNGLQKIEKILQQLEVSTGVKGKVLFSFSRQSSHHRRLFDEKEMQNSPISAIVGIDFLGDEATLPVFEAAQDIYGPRFGKTVAIKKTLHAGERGDVRNARDGMLLGADRLGHGLALDQDPVALEWAARRQLPVEMSLTSNLRLAGVSDLSLHPLLRFLRLGLKPSLSTDNEGILQTDIAQDCRRLVMETDVSYAEMRQLFVNSLDASFLPEAEKRGLLQKLEEQLAGFEKKWCSEKPADC